VDCSGVGIGSDRIGSDRFRAFGSHSSVLLAVVAVVVVPPIIMANCLSVLGCPKSFIVSCLSLCAGFFSYIVFLQFHFCLWPDSWFDSCRCFKLGL